MRNFALGLVLAGTATAITGCATVAPVTAANTACGTYGYIDVNNDGFITGDEWNTYRTNAYGYWDVDKDGRISRSEFENCWRGGGFYRDAYYNPGYWSNYWSAFDANNDGYLSANEYWSAEAWTRIDANANGRIDSNEWVWWPR
jgi:hypothetical protein